MAISLILLFVIAKTVLAYTLGCDQCFQSASCYTNPANNFTNCPPQWYFCNGHTDTCECGEGLDGLVHCDPEMDYTLVLNGYCMTYDNNMTVVGPCLYNFFNISKAAPFLSNYHILPLNTSLNDGMCGHFNREGNLCGKCKDNYSLPAYSYDLHCIECTYTSYNWAKFVLAAFGPLTLLLFLVFLFRISLTSPPLIAFIILSQIMTAPLVVRIFLVSTEGNAMANMLVRIITSVYGIWNLDFFRTLLPPICLQLTTLQTLLLDYAIAFYPLVLILIIYMYFAMELQVHNSRIVVWLLTPIRRCCVTFRIKWDVNQRAIIHVFTSFTFLSFVKVLNVSFDILVTTRSYNVHGETLDTFYLYFNPTINYFGEEHLPYAIPALLVLFVTVTLPFLLLFLYPFKCFQRCLEHFPSRVRTALRIYMEAFQGCLKDGTGGVRDCRHFEAVYLGMAHFLYILYALVPNAYYWPLTAVVHIIVGILHIIIQPYKPDYYYYNYIASCMFLLMAAYCTLYLGIITTSSHAPNYLTMTVIIFTVLLTLPQLYITGVLGYWLVSKVSHTRMPSVNAHKISMEKLPHRINHPEEYW